MGVNDLQNFLEAFSDFVEFLRGGLTIAQERVENTGEVGLELGVGEL